jgi:type VI secretion system protein VasG
MLTIDIKNLLARLNPLCTRALEGAAGSCISRSHYEVTVEHLFAKLLEETEGDLTPILRHYAIDARGLCRAVEQSIEGLSRGNSGKPVFSPTLIQWCQDAWLISSIDLAEPHIRSGALLAALLAKPLHLANGPYPQILQPISKASLVQRFEQIAHGSGEATAAQTGQPRSLQPENNSNALARFCTDFTEKARRGDIDPVFGRDREISQMIDILARRRKNNPIVVGEAGVGKTAVVEGLALRIIEGDVPDFLRDVAILGLDLGLLQAGAGVKGEFENRLKSVIAEVNASPRPTILFIDEAHTLIGAGGQAGSGDAANLLKPALARGELRTIAATTWSEYKKYFERDAALARRFQPVKLDEPTVATTTMILRGLKDTYEQAHGVTVRDDAIIAAAELANRYISGRQLPDKAVDLLDTSAARVKILLTAKPELLTNQERTIQNLQRELTALARDDLHGAAVERVRQTELQTELAAVRSECAARTSHWQAEQTLVLDMLALRSALADRRTQPAEDGRRKGISDRLADVERQLRQMQGDAPLVHAEVDPDMVARVVSDWTGIPLGKVLRDQASTIMGLEDDLGSRIKGQSEALHVIAETLRAAKAGLNDPSRPQGIFLLVGPSGVGKTETARAVAELLFGGDRFLTTVNMSEFQEAHTVSRLIGSPPGYVGFGEGGMLTEAVRRQPYSVILMDEVEKAHLDVVNLFYQVFDKGTLADGEGRAVDFKNSVLFLTSNLGAELLSSLCSDGRRPQLQEVIEAIRPILSRHFKPALLARMTIVPYLPLDRRSLQDIIVLQLSRLADRLWERSRTRLSYAHTFVQRLAERCTQVETGARNIEHILNGTIIPQLSREILARMGSDAMPPTVRLSATKQGGFTVRLYDAK